MTGVHGPAALVAVGAVLVVAFQEETRVHRVGELIVFQHDAVDLLHLFPNLDAVGI